ncbi:MAG: DNA-binding protein WhiA [Vulcanimicrobiota bacterium]
MKRKSQRGREEKTLNVSFSMNAREEISRNFPEKLCCKEALLAGYIFSTISSPPHNGNLLEIKTRLSSVARLIYKILKEVSQEIIEWKSDREKFLYKRKIYHIFAPFTPSMQEYLRRWGIFAKLQKKNIRRACCRRFFLAGAFLAAGSVSSPGNYYHLEITQKDMETARTLVKIMARMEVTAKIIHRRNKIVVYVKKAENIANLLNILGAYNALLKFEEIRAIKETKEEVRRKVNAETSNLDKTAKAATRQVHNISILKEAGVLPRLPKKLKQAADLRLEYPEATLKELGELFSPPLAKSSVNSHLRRLEQIARSVKNKNVKIN